MKFTRIVEETVSGTAIEKYRIRMDEEYSPLDVASDEFSIVAAGAIDILECHINIANYWIGWIKALEKTNSDIDPLSSFTTIGNTPEVRPVRLEECPLTDTPLTDRDVTKADISIGDMYMVIANMPIKGTIGNIKKTVDNIVELFIPFNYKGITFYLRADQVSKVNDVTYCRVMVGEEEINTATGVKIALEKMGLKTIFSF